VEKSRGMGWSSLWNKDLMVKELIGGGGGMFWIKDGGERKGHPSENEDETMK